MGSEVLKAVSEQKGNIESRLLTSNPPYNGGPIEQSATPITTNNLTSKPIQQRFQLKTKPNGHGDSEFSVPIEQAPNAKFGVKEGSDIVKVIQQFVIVTANDSRSNFPGALETPIQQVEFTTEIFTGFANTSNLVEQRITKTSGSSTSRPIQLMPRIQNAIQITQFDFVDSIFPACNSTKNAVSTNILWRIKDFGFPFSVPSLIFTVKGIEVQDTPEFVVTNLPTGLQIFYDPPSNFGFEEQVTCFLSIDDTAVPANTFKLRCTWETVADVRPPFFRNISPACNSTSVSVLSPISFNVLDFGEGVDPDSIRLSVEGVTVCSGLTLDPIVDQDFTTISGIPVGADATGYLVTYEHPFDPWRYGSNVTISMEASDLSALRNRVLFVCAFDVEESQPPVFINTKPEPCESFIDNRSGLSFEVYGVEHGIDISTLEVRVDNTLRKVFVRPKILRTE